MKRWVYVFIKLTPSNFGKLSSCISFLLCFQFIKDNFPDDARESCWINLRNESRTFTFIDENQTKIAPDTNHNLLFKLRCLISNKSRKIVWEFWFAGFDIWLELIKTVRFEISIQAIIKSSKLHDSHRLVDVKTSSEYIKRNVFALVSCD